MANRKLLFVLPFLFLFFVGPIDHDVGYDPPTIEYSQILTIEPFLPSGNAIVKGEYPAYFIVQDQELKAYDIKAESFSDNKENRETYRQPIYRKARDAL